MKRVLPLLIAGFVFSFCALAQQRNVSGKVTSQTDGAPLPGVSVLVKGTTTGTVTDIDGKYSIAVPESGGTLIFSFIGFTMQEIPVGANSVVDVSLAEDVTQLTEVIVVGYGTQLKQDLTGNIASVKGAEIQNLPTPNIEQAIQGRMAGVFVESGNGKLGQGIKVRVRGAASVSASNEPLYVIDGMIINTDNESVNAAPTNPLADINFNDVESIQVLKDASAAAIYGSRAANGVVLITTKKGKAGKTKFNLGYLKGFSQPTRKAEWLNGPQYLEAFREAFENSGGEAEFGETFEEELSDDIGLWDPNASVNWADQAYRDDAGIDQIDLTASGGNDKTTFYTALQYQNNRGILIKNQLERVSARINIDHKASDKLSLGMNFNVVRTLNQRLSTDNAFSTPMQLLALPPIQPIYDADTGELNENTVYYNGLIERDNAKFTSTVFRNITNIHASYLIVPGLTFRSEAGADVLIQNDDQFNGAPTDVNTGNINGGGLSRYVTLQNYSTNNFLSYAKQMGALHNIEAVAGISYQIRLRDQTQLSAQTFPSDKFTKLISASVITGGNSSANDFSFVSYFGRVNYKLKNKYLLALSGRVDGSSKFGDNNKYGFFPAGSLGWIMSEESFLSSSHVISFLKLRGSVGVTGNAPTQDFASRPLFNAQTYGTLGGVVPQQLANPDLKWETTVQTDFGIDFGVLQDRITGEVDYYVKKTTDVLLNANVPGTSGFLTKFINVGELENKGVEVVINTNNFVGEFKWSTSFNFARNTNTITNLDGNIIEGGFINRAVEGQPIGVHYGVEYAGVDPANGDALYYINATEGDRSTTNDFSQANRVVIGNPNPKWIGGMTNNFSYKGFDLSVLINTVQGNDVYNAGGRFQRASFDFYDNHLVEDWKNAWRNPGDITDVPQSRLFGGNGSQVSSRYIQDASYIRLKTVTLGYNFPHQIIDRLSLSSLRLYVSGQNLATITKYDLNDPEVNTDFTSSNIGQGNDFYAAPQAKTISFGINIGF